MRSINIFSSTIVLMLALFSTAFLARAGTDIFERNLRVGSNGEDVRSLQIILNSLPQTAISSPGPGSSGQETTYFGAKTREAVIRFQEYYRSEILIPNGLVSGTGFVGASTLKVLNRIHAGGRQAVVPAAPPSKITSPVAVDQATNDQQSLSTTENQNMKNLDKFVDIVGKIGREKGLSEEKISLITQQIRKDAANSADFRSTFIRLVEQASAKAPSSSRSLVYRLLNMLTSLAPQQVYAQASGDLPFGGALIYSYLCTCNGNWLITVEPLAPTYVVLLTYTPGTQAYLSYNIPYTTQLLGKYMSGQGNCSTYAGASCVTIPSEGMITSTVGSSSF